MDEKMGRTCNFTLPINLRLSPRYRIWKEKLTDNKRLQTTISVYCRL